jgi:hypothetical protein
MGTLYRDVSSRWRLIRASRSAQIPSVRRVISLTSSSKRVADDEKERFSSSKTKPRPSSFMVKRSRTRISTPHGRDGYSAKKHPQAEPISLVVTDLLMPCRGRRHHLAPQPLPPGDPGHRGERPSGRRGGGPRLTENVKATFPKPSTSARCARPSTRSWPCDGAFAHRALTIQTDQEHERPSPTRPARGRARRSPTSSPPSPIATRIGLGVHQEEEAMAPEGLMLGPKIDAKRERASWPKAGNQIARAPKRSEHKRARNKASLQARTSGSQGYHPEGRAKTAPPFHGANPPSQPAPVIG